MSRPTFSLYWHTIRHLRPGQILGRVAYKLQQFRRVASDEASPLPRQRCPTGRWVRPVGGNQSLTGPTTIRLLNQTNRIESAGDWDRKDWPLLWRFNLHYFDDLNAWDAGARTEWHIALIQRWIEENRIGVGTAWHPYPTSLRMVNWIKWFCAGQDASSTALGNLASQARYLSKRLERHLLGNHLFSNAKALVFAGLFFEGPGPRLWLETGLRIIEQELGEQILDDGGHFERSPMYHALALEDILDLQNACARYRGAVPEEFRSTVARLSAVTDPMREWLETMCHPDGDIGFFNDAALGLAPRPDQLDAYAQRLGHPPLSGKGDGITHLEASGYFRVQQAPVVALLDCAPIGPDYLPGHAHADTLSFEWSVHGQRVIVNGGTSQYGCNSQRQYERSTAAHSTVEVDHEDSSEVWGAFRVARRAYPLDVRIEDNLDALKTVHAAHDGYRRLGVTHRRTWTLGSDRLTIADRVDGKHGIALARFHIHPKVEILPATSSSGRLTLGSCRIDYRILKGEGHWIGSTYHPEFGCEQASQCLVVRLDRGDSQVAFVVDT